MISKGP